MTVVSKLDFFQRALAGGMVLQYPLGIALSLVCQVR